MNESGAVQSASAIDGIIMTAVWIPIARPLFRW